MPLRDVGSPDGLPRLNPPERTRFTYYPGAVSIPDSAAPPTRNRSHVITAEIEVPPTGAEGVLVADGGVGTDTGSPVGAYPSNYVFAGQIRQVTVELK